MGKEFGILFDAGAWVVMYRYTDHQGKPEGGAFRDQACPSIEAALTYIQMQTGSPVLLKVVTGRL